MAIGKLQERAIATDGRVEGIDKHLGSLERRVQEGQESVTAKVQGIVDTMNSIGNRGWVAAANIILSILSPLAVAYLMLKLLK